MAMTTMVAMGATVTLTLAMVEAGAMVGAMEVAGDTAEVTVALVAMVTGSPEDAAEEDHQSGGHTNQINI